MPQIRVAIATPSRNMWSETFIAAHLERLKEVVLVLSEGSLPYAANGVALLTPGGISGRLRNLVDLRLLKKDNAQVVRERITEELKRLRVDVLLAEYGPTGEELIESAQAAGVPLVAHFHGYDAHRHDALEHAGNYVRLFREAAAIVVVSRLMEQQLLRLGAPRERLHYLCYGIDVERFTPGTPGNNPPHFVGVGRFTGKKAPQLTLLAFHQAWLQRPDARLTMVGSGELWEGVRQMITALGMEHAVDLPGVLSPEQIAERLRGARAFVQHSLTSGTGDMEGTPLAVLEAMAAGLPVVSTVHAGIPDVVAHGERGLLSAEYDTAAMAAHLVQLIDHPELAASMGNKGRAYVEAHHRVEDRVGALQVLLEQVAAHTG